MIDVYYWPTPNGWKVTIMLEECGLDYKIVPVDIGGGGQFTPEFLRISPNNRMPAIVDHDPMGGGEPISIFESGAILEYLGDKTGRFLPRTPHGHGNPEEIRAELQAAGFTDITIDVVTETSTAPSASHPAVAYVQGTPLRGEIEKHGADMLQQVTEAATRRIEDRFGAGPVSAKIQGLVITAS